METSALKIDRILVADDLMREHKAEPTGALRLAWAVARPFGAEIHLVHGYYTPELSVPTEAMALLEQPYIEAMTRALESEAESMHRQDPKLPVQTHVERGHAVEVLLRDISAYGCQLIVLSTHGRKGMRRALLGSVAEEVIRRSPVPVLCVNPHVNVSPQLELRKVLVPVDMSSTTGSVVASGARFAHAFQGSVTLLSVVEEWVYPIVQSASLLAGGFVMPLERDLQELANLRNSQLHELAEPLMAQGVPVSTRLIERAASVGGAIVEEARAGQYDVIAMGHRHASRFEYAVLGSVSRYVIREAHCPVLVFPPTTVTSVTGRKDGQERVAS